MKMRNVLCVGLFVVFGTTTTAYAQKEKKKAPAPAGMAMPTAKPDAALSEYKDMIGTWKCTGVMKMAGQEIPTKGTAKFKWDLDKFWVVGSFESPKSKGMPGYKGTAYYGYDPGRKVYVMLSVDSMGGWGEAISNGWKSDVQEWTGKANMMGQEMDIKSTITRKGPKEVSIVDQMGSGPQAMTSQTTCKKR